MAFYKNKDTQNVLKKSNHCLIKKFSLVNKCLKEDMKGIKTHCRKWLVGGQLYEEDDELDLVPPGKSALIYFHDAEKGKQNGFHFFYNEQSHQINSIENKSVQLSKTFRIRRIAIDGSFYPSSNTQVCH